MSRDFIIGPQAPLGDTWFDKTQIAKGKVLGEAFPPVPPTDPTALNDYLVNRYYYDLGKSLYIAHKRSGDPAFLTLAEKCVDSWWQFPSINQGRNRNADAKPAPRNAALGGLMIRAMQRPEMWDWLVWYLQAANGTWLKPRINYPTLHYGLREGAFTLQGMAWLSRVLPDSYPLLAGGTATNGAETRAQMLADVEMIATDYYGRLQFSDGSWRWNDHDVKDADGGTLVGITQPFMVGLLMQALIVVHQVTDRPTVKESVKNQILNGCRHLYSGGPYRKDDPTPYDPNKRWRCFWYIYHGGTTINPTKFERGGWSLPGVNHYEVSDARQSIGPVVGAFGYAYSITGDLFFKQAGEELWDAAYNGTDGIRNLFDSDGKGYNQNVSGAANYLVWRGQPAIPSPTPAPSPTPTPTPTPVPTNLPSPDGTEGPTITDSEGAVWTLGPSGRTLRNGVDAGGAGKKYLYWQKVVYLQGMSDGWFKWAGTAWKSIGTTRPPAPIVQPAPTPIPVPQPVPVPVKEEYVIKTLESVEAARTKLLQEMFGLGYAAWEEVKGIIKFRLFPNP